MFIHDPVCGKRISPNKAHITVSYRGMAFHLCCPLCQSEFERNPDKFAGQYAKGRPVSRRQKDPSEK